MEVKIKDAVILTGGSGTRLRPYTTYVSKHLLNVAGKPIIDYPINTLKQMGVENLTIVVGSSFSGQILDYIQDGSQYEMNINYCYQKAANGISFAVNLAQRYVGNKDRFAVCLGDNVFENPIFWSENDKDTAQIALCEHPELNRFGVASIDKNNKIVKIEEKPKIINNKYKNFAITGCYLFTPEYFEYFKETKQSGRGEFEICDIINKYHKNNKLDCTTVSGLWSDVGMHESIAYVENYLFNKALGY